MEYMESALESFVSLDHAINNFHYDHHLEGERNQDGDDEFSVIGDRYSQYLDSYETHLLKVFKGVTDDLSSAITRLESEVVMGHYYGETGEELPKQVHGFAEHVAFIVRNITSELHFVNTMEDSVMAQFGPAFEASTDRVDAALNKWKDATVESERRLRNLHLFISRPVFQ